MGWLLLFFLTPYLACIAGTTSSPEPGAATKIDNCYRYDVDGCSIPFELPFFFKKLFTRSCNRHDICYHCGVAYNISKHVCDTFFMKNTMKACKVRYHGMHSPISTHVISILEDHYSAFRSILKLEATRFLSNFEKPTKEELQLHLMVFRRSEIIRKWAVMLSQLLRQRLILNKSNNTKQDSGKSTLRKPDVNAENVKKAKYDVKTDQGRSGDNRFGKHSTQEAKKFKYDVVIKPGPELYISGMSREEEAFCEKTFYSLNLRREKDLPGEKLGCKEIILLSCYLFSDVYYLAVDLFASSSYHWKPEFYCHQDFVPKCLPRIP